MADFPLSELPKPAAATADPWDTLEPAPAANGRNPLSAVPADASTIAAPPVPPVKATSSDPWDTLKPAVRPAVGAMENLRAGWDSSNLGLIFNRKLPTLIADPKTRDFLMDLSHGVGKLAGDLPSMIVGGIAGGSAGAAAGSLIPIPGVGTLGGGLVGSWAGMGLVPSLISETLMDFYKSGAGQTKEDFWAMLQESAKTIAKDTAFSAATGAALGPINRVIGRAVGSQIGKTLAVPVEEAGKRAVQTGGADVAQRAGEFAALVLAMPTVPALLQGHLPDKAEFGHAAIIIGGLTAGHIATGRVIDTYLKTGRTPAQQVADVQAGKVKPEDYGPARDPYPPAEDMFGKVYNPTGTSSGVPLAFDRLIAEAQQLARGGVPEAPDIKALVREIKAAGPLQGDLVPGVERLDVLVRKAAEFGALTPTEQIEAATLRAKLQAEAEKPRMVYPEDAPQRAVELADARLGELATKAEATPLTDAERAERVFLTNARATPEALRDHFKLGTLEAPRRGITPEQHEASVQRVHDDVLEQVRQANSDRARRGDPTTGDDHAQGVARLVARRVANASIRNGELPWERYERDRFNLRDATALKREGGHFEGEHVLLPGDITGGHPRTAKITRVDDKGRVLDAEKWNDPTYKYLENGNVIDYAENLRRQNPDAPRPAPESSGFTPPEVDIFGNPIEVTNAPRHAVEGLPTVELSLKGLEPDKDVPQFKKDANDQGVVVPLGGVPDRVGFPPIQVWEHLDGRLGVISGRHRLELWNRHGETTIPAQIHREADGFTRDMAAMLDAELNIRDEQGSVADYAQYFKTTGLTKEAANAGGLLARAKGAAGFAIARDASPDLLAAHRTGFLPSGEKLSDDAALTISGAAPGSERLQALGLTIITQGKSLMLAVNTMKAMEVRAADRIAAGKQGDLWSFDDGDIVEATKMADRASAEQRRIGKQIAAVRGPSNNPELAKREGVNIEDAAGLRARIDELREEQRKWDSWPTQPELVAKLRDGTLKQGPVDVGTSDVPETRTIEDLAADLKKDHPDVQMRFGNDVAGGVYLADIAAKTPGEGAGPRAMADFTRWLDTNGKKSSLLASATGDVPLAKVVAFYEKHGYIANDIQPFPKDGVAMHRLPKEPANETQASRTQASAEGPAGIGGRAGDGPARLGSPATGEEATARQEVTDFELTPETPAEIKRRDEEAVAAARRKLFQASPSKQVRVDPDSLSREVLSKMDRALKAAGYDSRGADDVLQALKTKIARGGIITFPDWIDAYEKATGSRASRLETKRAADLKKEQATNVDFERLRALGTTTDMREGGYITPSGSMIDLSGKREGGEPGSRSYDHREAGGTIGMQEFMALGNIRMDHNAGSLDMAKTPTQEQYRKIAEFTTSRAGKVVIDLREGLGEQRNDYYLNPERTFSREYPKDTKPSRIATDIERFYAGDDPAPLILRQQNQDTNRGSYDIEENLITTLQGADKSTVVHELWHSWLEEMKRDAARDGAPEQIKRDWEMLRQELAIPESGDISRASHEQFARSGERYLGSGEAPSLALKGVFEQFKQWLLNIYRDLANLNVKINPELKEVLDRMLATDEEIAAAKELNVPRAYVGEAMATVAARIVPPPETARAGGKARPEPGFIDERLSVEPFAEELLPGPGSGLTNDSRINAQYINGPMDLKLAIQQIANRDQANIQEKRGGAGGVKSWADTNAEVDRLAEETMGGKLAADFSIPGQPPIPHDLQQRAAFRVTMAIAKYSLGLRDAILEKGVNATVQEQFDYLSSVVRMRMAHAEFLGLRAASARALNQIRDMTPESGMVDKMIEATGGDGRLFQAGKTDAEVAADLKLKLDEIMAQHFGGRGALDIAKLSKDIKSLSGQLKLAKAVTDATKWEMVIEGWRAGLLSGPQTPVTNVLGTWSFMALRVPVDAVAAMIGMARGASVGLGESDRANMSVAIARITGSLSGIENGLKVAYAALKTDESSVTQKVESFRAAIPGFWGRVARFPYRVMSAGDALTTTMYKSGELKGLAVLRAFDENLNPGTREFSDRVNSIMRDPPEDLNAMAEAAARRMAFNQRGGEKTVALQGFIKKWHLEWMIPFVNTPINIAAEMIRMTPLAPTISDWRADIRKGGMARDRAIAEIVVGSGIMALTMAYAFDGQISGSGSPDPGKNRGKAGVWQPNSVLVGDTWYEIGRLQPGGTLMVLAADVANAWDHMTDEERDKVPKILAMAFSNAITNQTFLQGITNVVHMMSEPDRYGKRFFQGLAGSMVPNIIGQPTAMADPYVRQVNSMLEAVLARIPGEREKLIANKDWLGEAVATKERMGFVLPVREQTVSKDKVRTEAARLDISMAAPPKKIHIGKGTGKLGDVELTPEERDKFAEIGGKMAHQMLTNLVNTPGYDTAPPMIQRNAFKRILTQAHRMAAIQALPLAKRMGYMQETAEKMQAALQPGEVQ